VQKREPFEGIKSKRTKPLQTLLFFFSLYNGKKNKTENAHKCTETKQSFSWPGRMFALTKY